MRPQVIYHSGNLIVAHHRPEWRHSALSVDDDVDGISAGFQIPVARERRIGSGACRAFAVGHVATPTDVNEQFLTAHFNKLEACA
jgi:hypothetical protein